MSRVLYKYLPPERNTYFSDGLLRFTPPSGLNDPYEGLPGISEDLLEKVFSIAKLPFHPVPEGLQVLEKDPDLFIEPFLRDGMAKIDSALGILSLSRRWDNPLMWSHYTESHQGFCVGYDASHNYFVVDENRRTVNGMTLLPVEYSDSRFMLMPQRMTREDTFASLCTKSTDWRYEKEERLITALNLATKTISAEPYDVALFNVPHEAISEIIIGLRSTEEIEGQAHDLALKLSVPLYKTYISRNSFVLERKLLNG